MPLDLGEQGRIGGDAVEHAPGAAMRISSMSAVSRKSFMVQLLVMRSVGGADLCASGSTSRRTGWPDRGWAFGSSAVRGGVGRWRMRRLRLGGRRLERSTPARSCGSRPRPQSPSGCSWRSYSAFVLSGHGQRLWRPSGLTGAGGPERRRHQPRSPRARPCFAVSLATAVRAAATPARPSASRSPDGGPAPRAGPSPSLMANEPLHVSGAVMIKSSCSST